MFEFVLLLSMLFCHIVDDFYLQPGVLSNMKQEKWWKENAPDKLYKNDYLVALLEHAFSWAFMVHIPVFVGMWTGRLSSNVGLCALSFATNWIVHAVVDNTKANKLSINLVTDQIIHVFQIMLIWLVCIFLS